MCFWRILKVVLISILVLSSGFGCSRKVKPKLDFDKFAVVYTDYVIAVKISTKRPNTAVFDSVLAHHKMQPEEFKATLTYYEKNPTEWESFIKNVLKQLEARLVEKPGKPDSLSQKIGEAKPIIP